MSSVASHNTNVFIKDNSGRRTKSNNRERCFDRKRLANITFEKERRSEETTCREELMAE